jgi:hypothetical protein
MFRYVLALAALLLVATPAVRMAGQSAATAPATLPSELTNAEFWRVASDISEPGGFFRIVDNYTSNEREVARIFSVLREGQPPGGVYIGVGPEQNFTYIAALRPKVAFIIDIRRQAVMQHLMFKAIFELADDRADFISLLFSKPRPAGLERNTSIEATWDAFYPVATSADLSARTYPRIVDRLKRTRGITLTDDEWAQLESVFNAFYTFGPAIATRGTVGGGGGSSVTFAALTGYTPDMTGRPRSFLATDEDFRYVKSLHERNLIIPVSGDFGGPKALRAIGTWIRSHGGVVNGFYVSNVEQYLYQDGKDRAFFDNVATLPVDDRSIFIRPYALRRGTMEQALCPIRQFLASVMADRVINNNDALACVK